MTNTPLQQSAHPITLALDVGTSSVRAVLFDSQAHPIEGSEGRTHYQMTATHDGGVEIEADKLVGFICQTLDQCLAKAGPVEIAAVGYSNFWHAMLGVDAEGRAVTPLYNWSDTRSADDAKALGERLGRAWIHQRTGVVPHASYYPAKITWLRRTNPQLAARVTRWVSIGEYFYHQVFGRFVCGVGMAAGTGLFDPNANDWSDEMLAAISVSREQLSPLAPLAAENEGLAGMRAEFAARWPALRNARWLPAIGDGATSNIGSGCSAKDRIAINVGTSGAMRVCWPVERVTIPSGLWCYRANRRYALIGGALSNAGDVYAWCRERLKLADAEIETQLAAQIPDEHGLTVLPFFSGERSTGWHSDARATISGLSLSTQPIEILRASLEAVCYRFAAIYERLKTEVASDARIIASGGGILHSRVWTQMLSDVIGVPVATSEVAEASSRGAALLAMEAFGLIESLSAVPTPLGDTFMPETENHERYLKARARQERLYETLIVNQ